MPMCGIGSPFLLRDDSDGIVTVVDGIVTIVIDDSRETKCAFFAASIDFVADAVLELQQRFLRVENARQCVC